MSNPIPIRLLKHSAVLYPYTGTTNGADQFGAAVNLSHIYVEPMQQNAMTSAGDMKNDTFWVFFDRVNSLPSGQMFKPKDKIVYEGLTCRVRKAQPIKPAASDLVHHWELNLI